MMYRQGDWIEYFDTVHWEWRQAKVDSAWGETVVATRRDGMTVDLGPIHQHRPLVLPETAKDAVAEFIAREAQIEKSVSAIQAGDLITYLEGRGFEIVPVDENGD